MGVGIASIDHTYSEAEENATTVQRLVKRERIDAKTASGAGERKCCRGPGLPGFAGVS